MKRLAVLWALALVPLGAEVNMVDHLQKTRQMFLDSIARLSEAQWKFKPSPDRWSVAECAEHITLSEDFLRQIVAEKVMKSPAEPDKKTEVQDERVLQLITNRTQRVQAPEPLQPSQGWDPQETTRRFEESRGRTIAYAQSNAGSLRSHFAPNQALGLIDAHQWLLFLSGHTERHTMQIHEVKAHPGFPKN